MLRIKKLTKTKEKTPVIFIIETLRGNKFTDEKIADFLWFNYVEKSNILNLNMSKILDTLEENSNLKEIFWFKCMRNVEEQFV